MLLNCGVVEGTWIPWTARRSNHSIIKEISPEYSLEGLMLKLKLQYFGHLMWRTDSLEKTLMLGNYVSGTFSKFYFWKQREAKERLCTLARKPQFKSCFRHSLAECVLGKPLTSLWSLTSLWPFPLICEILKPIHLRNLCTGLNEMKHSKCITISLANCSPFL